MGTRFGEKADPAVRHAPRDEVLAQQTNRCRRLARHKVVREGKRNPAVLPDELSHGSTPLDSGDQLVLFAGHHSPLLPLRPSIPCSLDRASSLVGLRRAIVFRQLTKSKPWTVARHCLE